MDRPLTLWFKNRGTIKPPSPLHFSVATTFGSSSDAVKHLIKSALAPFLDGIPAPAINIYVWNPSSEDYLWLPPDHVMGTNPIQEVLKDIPGFDATIPLFFDYVWVDNLRAEPTPAPTA